MPDMAVTVILDAQQRTALDLFRSAPMGEAPARAWLDAQFGVLGCQPLRASGKVLQADKVLLVAQAAAAQPQDSDWWRSYACAAHAVLGRVPITVDVPAMAVVY